MENHHTYEVNQLEIAISDGPMAMWPITKGSVSLPEKALDLSPFFAVRQAIHFDDSKRLRRALLDAPRVSRPVFRPLGFWAVARQKNEQTTWDTSEIDTVTGNSIHMYTLFLCIAIEDFGCIVCHFDLFWAEMNRESTGVHYSEMYIFNQSAPGLRKC